MIFNKLREKKFFENEKIKSEKIDVVILTSIISMTIICTTIAIISIFLNNQTKKTLTTTKTITTTLRYSYHNESCNNINIFCQVNTGLSCQSKLKII
jgi:hypothetical protein